MLETELDDDDIGMVDCCENNNIHGCLCDNLTCDCICHEADNDHAYYQPIIHSNRKG